MDIQMKPKIKHGKMFIPNDLYMELLKSCLYGVPNMNRRMVIEGNNCHYTRTFHERDTDNITRYEIFMEFTVDNSAYRLTIDVDNILDTSTGEKRAVITDFLHLGDGSYTDIDLYRSRELTNKLIEEIINSN